MEDGKPGVDAVRVQGSAGTQRGTSAAAAQCSGGLAPSRQGLLAGKLDAQVFYFIVHGVLLFGCLPPRQVSPS